MSKNDVTQMSKNDVTQMHRNHITRTNIQHVTHMHKNNDTHMSMNQITHMNIDHRMEQIALKVITTAIYKSFRKEIRMKEIRRMIYICQS